MEGGSVYILKNCNTLHTGMTLDNFCNPAVTTFALASLQMHTLGANT